MFPPSSVLFLYAFFLLGSGALANSELQNPGEISEERPQIQVDLGPFDTPATRQALELRRDKLVFGVTREEGWQLRVRALDGEPGTLSVIFSRTTTQRYIQEFSLDLVRGDAERQIATSLANWIDAVFADEHRPATAKEVQAQHRKERAMPEDSSSDGGTREEANDTSNTTTVKSSEDLNDEGSEGAARGKPSPTKSTAFNSTRAEPARARARRARVQRPGRGSWSFASPTHWELGVGLGMGGSLQGGPWLPGWSWLALHGTWTPKAFLRLGLRARWQSHPLNQAYVHRVRLEAGPEWMARGGGRLGIPLGLAVSAERWWTQKEVTAASGLARILSLGLVAHAGVSWRLTETASGMVTTGLQAQVRYSSEIPGWVVPTVSFQTGGPRLFVGGLEWGLLWSLHWGKKK